MADKKQAIASGDDLAPLTALLDSAYPVRLREIAEQLYLGLVQAPDTQALGHRRLAELALSLTEHLSQTLGGSQFYMHKGTSYRLSFRDREMCARFTGDNYHELSLIYRRTEQRVRQIVDAYQREQFERRQITLVGMDTGRAAQGPSQRTA